MSIKYCINPECNYRNIAQDDQHNDGICVACEQKLPASDYSSEDANDGEFEQETPVNGVKRHDGESDADYNRRVMETHAMMFGFNID